jgi:lipoyl(octanoyl) transferase
VTVTTSIPVRVLGLAPDLVDYREALELQQRTAAAVAAGETRGDVFLLEHPPVYTAGRRADPAEYPVDGTPVVPVDRGGKVTWHGPGQLVGYPVFELREHLRLVPYVRRIEQALIDALADVGVEAFRVEKRTGVWVNTGRPFDEKIAQIGIHAKRGITTHGFALNCSTDNAVFTGFVPCGITDAGVTSISAVLGRDVAPADMVPVLTPYLERLIEEVAVA